MANERAEEIGFLRKRVPRSLDECSEGQSDHEKVEEHVSGPKKLTKILILIQKLVLLV